MRTPLQRTTALVAALAPALALAFSIPPAPPRFLYDGASILNGSERQQIESRLMQLNQQGQQIGVCILPSLDGESIEDASLRIAETWKPGFRREDNGALIAVFINDRKMRIEVGYGLESRIPDSVARQIVMEQMRPAFRRGDYAGGITSAIESISQAALGQSYSRRGTGTGTVGFPGGYHFDSDQVGAAGWGGFGCCCWIALAFVILRMILRSIFRPRFYGFGQQAVSRPVVPWWGWFLFGNAMGSNSYRHHHHRSGWSWGSSSGGGWGGGGGGSFGGGSFGGGGASGSW